MLKGMIFLKKALSFVLAFVLLSSLVMGFAMTAQAAGSKTVSVSGYNPPQQTAVFSEKTQTNLHTLHQVLQNIPLQ